jgi:hypothetical protein
LARQESDDGGRCAKPPRRAPIFEGAIGARPTICFEYESKFDKRLVNVYSTCLYFLKIAGRKVFKD